MEENVDKLTLIEEHIAEITAMRNEQKSAWTKAKFKLLKEGRTKEELKQAKLTYITRELTIELRKLKQQQRYYNDKSSHQNYYQTHREEIMAKRRLKRLEKTS